MLIIGCDFHPSVQQIAFVDTETGECGERRLAHCAEAEQFYRELKQKGVTVRVGIEATGQSRWFERLLAQLNFELWIGDAAQIRAKQVRKQKNDRKDAEHLLKLMMKDDFPRIWVPSPENRDVRQLLWHRHRLVQMRTRVMNQLQAIALNGVAPKPYRATKAEAAIAGKPINDANADAAGLAAVADAAPLPSSKYKVQIAKTLVKRALLACK